MLLDLRNPLSHLPHSSRLSLHPQLLLLVVVSHDSLPTDDDQDMSGQDQEEEGRSKITRCMRNGNGPDHDQDLIASGKESTTSNNNTDCLFFLDAC